VQIAAELDFTATPHVEIALTPLSLYVPLSFSYLRPTQLWQRTSFCALYTAVIQLHVVRYTASLTAHYMQAEYTDGQ
jgi:hypothetical protein